MTYKEKAQDIYKLLGQGLLYPTKIRAAVNY
jgi:hypothetical protein